MRAALARSRRRVDVLSVERANKRISLQAYEVGRSIQHLLERQHRTGSGWSEAGRIDAGLRPDRAVELNLRQARNVVEVMTTVERAIGTVGAKAMKALLIDGRGFAEVAPPGFAAKDAASVFRFNLEGLAAEFGRRGLLRQRVDQ